MKIWFCAQDIAFWHFRVCEKIKMYGIFPLILHILYISETNILFWMFRDIQKITACDEGIRLFKRLKLGH